MQWTDKFPRLGVKIVQFLGWLVLNHGFLGGAGNC
jgi:hypothetical protein